MLKSKAALMMMTALMAGLWRCCTRAEAEGERYMQRQEYNMYVPDFLRVDEWHRLSSEEPDAPSTITTKKWNTITGVPPAPTPFWPAVPHLIRRKFDPNPSKAHSSHP